MSASRDRVGFLDKLRRLCLDMGRVSEAVEIGSLAVAAMDGLRHDRFARDTEEDRQVMVSLLINQATAFNGAGRPDDAERALIEAGRVVDKLRNDFPGPPGHDDLAATVLELLATSRRTSLRQYTKAREDLVPRPDHSRAPCRQRSWGHSNG